MPKGIYIRSLQLNKERRIILKKYWDNHPEIKIKISLHRKGKCVGETHYAWKGGISRDKSCQGREYQRKYHKEYRHRKGISKEYRSEYSGISFTKEYRKLHRKMYKYLRKNAGELTVNIIQFIYEDNIKRYGTLTCYLCLQPIEFGKDHLEHKIPLSRGGTNARENLDIACQKCNNKKFNKTEAEYRNRITANIFREGVGNLKC